MMGTFRAPAVLAQENDPSRIATFLSRQWDRFQASRDLQSQEKEARDAAAAFREDAYAALQTRYAAYKAKPIQTIDDIFSQAQIELMSEAGELYHMGLDLQRELLKTYEQEFADVEIRNLVRYREFGRNQGYQAEFAKIYGQESLIVYLEILRLIEAGRDANVDELLTAHEKVFDGKRARFLKVFQDLMLLRDGKVDQLRKNIARDHLLNNIMKNAISDIRHPLGLVKLNQIGGKFIVRVFHRKSRISIVYGREGEVIPTAPTTQQYLDRINIRAAPPTVINPNGDRSRPGTDAVLILVSDRSAVEHDDQMFPDQPTETLDIKVQKKPRIFSKTWFKTYGNAVGTKPTGEKMIFGGVCGAVQVGLQACFGNGQAGELAPAALTFAYGGGIGANDSTYRFWKDIGGFTRTLLKHSAITYSFNYLYYTATHGMSVFDPSNALGFYSLQTHTQMLIVGYLMLYSRSKLEDWSRVWERLRIGQGFFKLHLGPIHIQSDSVKWIAVFSQLFVANLSWIFRIYHLRHPEEAFHLGELARVTYGQLGIVGMAFLAPVMIATNLLLLQRNVAMRNSAVYRELLADYRGKLERLDRFFIRAPLRFLRLIPEERKQVLIPTSSYMLGRITGGMSWFREKFGAESVKIGYDEVDDGSDPARALLHERARIDEEMGPLFARHLPCGDLLLGR